MANYKICECSIDVSEVSLLASVAEGVGLAVENSRRSRLAAVLQERDRLARELHDSVTQSLYSLTLFSEWTAGLLHKGDYAEAEAKLKRIAEIARQVHKEMRLLLYELRSAESICRPVKMAVWGYRACKREPNILAAPSWWKQHPAKDVG